MELLGCRGLGQDASDDPFPFQMQGRVVAGAPTDIVLAPSIVRKRCKQMKF